MKDFVHLHLHTVYSLLDGAVNIDRLMKKVALEKQSAVAITDHGAMYGAIEFYKAAKKAGIKPIIGCECYVAARGRKDRIHGQDSEIFHLVLLCKNETGYKNLIKMVSLAWTEGFYKKPRIDRELLKQHHDGLIALSACLAGEIPRALSYGNYEKAKETALFYKDIFGEDFYIELQDHDLADEKRNLPLLLKLARECNIPPVATNDVHYIEKEDARAQQVLVCIQTNKTIADDDRLEFGSDEFYFKSGDEMTELFKSCPEAIDNTVKIADKCNLEFEFRNTKLPRFDIDEDISHFEYLKRMCEDGLKKRYDTLTEEITNRLNYELSVIDSMGYTDYYLIVHDFVSYAKRSGISVGPGRGSGAGSIAAYAIGITDIDPMKYNLLFERFLNPERVSMPDFDIDFCYERRGEVIDYVINKYGSDHVAQIVTFGTMAARGAVRDVGRVLGISYSEVDTVAKLIPNELNMTITKALERSADLKRLYNQNPRVKELIDTSLLIEGTPRNTSTHAAGVVITDLPVDNYVPLAKNGDSTVTQYTMTLLEELGLLKIDFLGLRTLTVISDAQKDIRKRVPDFDIEKIPTDDPETFRMLQRGQSDGVFQFESGGMKRVMAKAKPTALEDLIAIIALYRPGPMDSIDTYVENRRHPDKIKYEHPMLEPIMKVTYGCLIYQEQVMEVFRSLAGYSYGRADIVRRAMSKKKHDVLEKERHTFIYGSEGENAACGAVKNGVPAEVAERIFDSMSSFASYAFNKSHAAAYALVAYRTAYLKCHYPEEFMASLLTGVLDSSSKTAAYIDEARSMGIQILPPSINESMSGFTVTGKGMIRFGLLAIKNLGRGLLERIISERQNGLFGSFYDFCSRVYGLDFNRRACESLIKSGALDNLGANRRQMLESIDRIFSELDGQRRTVLQGQMGFFDMEGVMPKQSFEPALPDIPELSDGDLLKMEKDILGFYITGHPMTKYSEQTKRINADRIADILLSDEDTRYHDDSEVTLLCMISSVRLKTTKKNSVMAFLNITDASGNMEMIVFPDTLQSCKDLIYEDNTVVIRGRVSLREERDPQIVCEGIYPLSIADRDTALKTLYLRIPSQKSSDFEQIKKLLDRAQTGLNSTVLYFSDTGKRVRYKKKIGLTDELNAAMAQIIGTDNMALK